MDNQVISSGTNVQVCEINIIENFKTEIETLDENQLNIVQKKLNYLCLKFDPYQVQNIDEESIKILTDFNLEKTISNPFDYTNFVLQMLDLVENKIGKNLQ